MFEKLGRAGFAELFRQPPVSSQQVSHPELYFRATGPRRVSLPSARLPSGYKKTLEGTLGELDHLILLRQYAGEQPARDLAPRWRAGRYALWENLRANRAVLHYAVEWESAAHAARYFEYYRSACGKKWKRLVVERQETGQVTGAGDDGRFVWTLREATFSSVEGLP